MTVRSAALLITITTLSAMAPSSAWCQEIRYANAQDAFALTGERAPRALPPRPTRESATLVATRSWSTDMRRSLQKDVELDLQRQTTRDPQLAIRRELQQQLSTAIASAHQPVIREAFQLAAKRFDRRGPDGAQPLPDALADVVALVSDRADTNPWSEPELAALRVEVDRIEDVGVLRSIVHSLAQRTDTERPSYRVAH